MNLLPFLLITVVIYLLSYLPGRIIAQYLPYDHKIKFAISFGISYFLFYLGGFSNYAVKIPYAYIYIMLGLFILPFAVNLFIKKHVGIPREEILLLGIFFLVFFFTLCLAAVRPVFSGATSYWDWYEHYRRSIIFLDNLPLYTMIGRYFLPQRMPLFNAAAAFFMSFLGKDFWIYQIASTLFNMSGLLGCFLLLTTLLRKNKYHLPVFTFLGALFVLNPYLMNMLVAHTITKVLSAYYVLLGFYFFMDDYLNRKTLSVYMAMLFLSMSLLVHFVSAPYILAAMLVIAISVIRRKKIHHSIYSLALFVGVLSTWYYWSYMTYGKMLTFFSNRSWEITRDLNIQQILRIFLYNSVYTIFPLISPYNSNLFENSTNYYVWLWDRIDSFYIGNIMSGITITASLAVIIFCAGKAWAVIREKRWKSDWKFIYLAVGIFIISGILHMIFGEAERGGLAPNLAPTVLMMLVVGAFCLIRLAEKWGKVFVYYGAILLVLESVVGIGYGLYVTKYQIDPQFNKNINFDRDLYSLPEPKKYQGFAVHLMNYKLKTDNHLVYLYDELKDIQPLFYVLIIAQWGGMIYLFIRILTSRLEDK